MASRPTLTRLELARLGAGLQQQELARQVGIVPGRLSAVERGNVSPTVELKHALARALGYRSEQLFPVGDAGLSGAEIKRWIMSLNDESPATRPSSVTQSPGRGRHGPR